MSNYNEFSDYLSLKKSKQQKLEVSRRRSSNVLKKPISTFAFSTKPKISKPINTTNTSINNVSPSKNRKVVPAQNTTIVKQTPLKTSQYIKNIFEMLYYEGAIKTNIQPKPTVLKVDEVYTNELGNSSQKKIFFSSSNPCSYVKITGFCSLPRKNEQVIITCKLKEVNNNKSVFIDQKSIYMVHECGTTFGPCIIPFSNKSHQKELLGLSKDKDYELQLFLNKSIIINYFKLHIEYIYN